CSARCGGSADAAPIVRSLVWIEPFLIRSQRRRHVLQVHSDACPGVKSPAHGVDEHVGGSQMRGRVGVTRLPPLETGEGIVFSRRTSDLDQRMSWNPPARWL